MGVDNDHLLRHWLSVYVWARIRWKALAICKARVIGDNTIAREEPGVVVDVVHVDATSVTGCAICVWARIRWNAFAICKARVICDNAVTRVEPRVVVDVVHVDATF
jgi:hypothetical protein